MDFLTMSIGDFGAFSFVPSKIIPIFVVLNTRKPKIERVGIFNSLKTRTTMKKVMKLMGLLTLMTMLVFAMSSFVKVNGTDSEKSCKVTIKYGNGDIADGVTVTASYYSSGQHDFKTNDDGVVTLTWEYSDIKCLYIKGDKYEVDYRDGKSYTLTLKKNNKYS